MVTAVTVTVFYKKTLLMFALYSKKLCIFANEIAKIRYLGIKNN